MGYVQILGSYVKRRSVIERTGENNSFVEISVLLYTGVLYS